MSDGNISSTWRCSEEYKLSEEYIGDGAYGVVRKAVHSKTKKAVAIKRVEGIVHSVLDVKRIYREIHILRYCCEISICEL